MSDFLFGYGSMMNPRSAGRALKRDVRLADLVPASLHGYSRRWSLKEQVRSEKLGREVTAVFLDLGPDNGARSNGVLIEITPLTLDYLRQREKNYEGIDVTASIDVHTGPHSALPGTSRVYTFIGRPEFVVRKADTGLFVMERYVKIVEDACAALGPAFERDYAASTEPIRFPRVEGAYVFVDQEQAKHV